MQQATNQEQVTEFQTRLAALSDEGYPFRSDRINALSRVFCCNPVHPADADPNKVYAVKCSITVYPDRNPNHGEYFQRGTLVQVEKIENGTARVHVQGKTFKVVQDASFGNTPARGLSWEAAIAGAAVPERFSLVELADAINVL